jgi:hypothetical protein
MCVLLLLAGAERFGSTGATGTGTGSAATADSIRSGHTGSIAQAGEAAPTIPVPVSRPGGGTRLGRSRLNLDANPENGAMIATATLPSEAPTGGGPSPREPAPGGHVPSEVPPQRREDPPDIGPTGPRPPHPVDDPGIDEPGGPGSEPDYLPGGPSNPMPRF